MTAIGTFLQQHRVTTQASPVRVEAGRLDLCRLFRASCYARGAEIGVWEGAFAERICTEVPGVHLLAVDPWRPYAAYREKKNDPVRLNSAYQTTTTRLARFDCRMLRMTSLEAAQQVPDGSLDFVYVDGNHEFSHVMDDLAAWTPKVRRGGIVSGHDFKTSPRQRYIQVEPAVRRFTADRGIGPVYVLAADKSPSWFWVQA